ncbi:hypothetical protein HEK616_10820 [Streptomyces nigrescens]|uniref:Uncharacterized protein n=1 Tax=Streptomyces nigrescens TaxID=1920 RepID=A0ABM7ZMR6_STRNI|nr:hypothetical protein HEK616_10820 [Streptomyces nigrescens]
MGMSLCPPGSRCRAEGNPPRALRTHTDTPHTDTPHTDTPPKGPDRLGGRSRRAGPLNRPAGRPRYPCRRVIVRNASSASSFWPPAPGWNQSQVLNWRPVNR